MKSFLAKLAGIPSIVWSFYAPILKQLLIEGAASLLPLALEIVEALADSKKTGAQKRELAVKKLTQVAVRNGIDASESLIRFTVESAVQKLKS